MPASTCETQRIPKSRTATEILRECSMHHFHTGMTNMCTQASPIGAKAAIAALPNPTVLGHPIRPNGR
eukprot:7667434-Alexandrium_andersonii.AAC.1